MKRLSADQANCRELGIPDAQGLILTTDVSEEDKKIMHAGLHRHVKMNIGDGDKGIKIRLILKDQAGGAHRRAFRLDNPFKCDL